MKLKDVVQKRPWRRVRGPIPTTRSVGAAVFERQAAKIQHDTQEVLEAIFAGDITAGGAGGSDFTTMVREHRDGLLRKLDSDLKFQDLIDQLQRLELLRELYERHPELVALAMRGRRSADAGLKPISPGGADKAVEVQK